VNNERLYFILSIVCDVICSLMFCLHASRFCVVLPLSFGRPQLSNSRCVGKVRHFGGNKNTSNLVVCDENTDHKASVKVAVKSSPTQLVRVRVRVSK